MAEPPALLGLRRWPRFALLMGLWTILGLIDAGQVYVRLNYYRGGSVRWEEALARGLSDWYCWAILAPPIFRLGQRYPFTTAKWGRRLALHLAFATVVIVVKVTLDIVTQWLIFRREWLVYPLSIEHRLADDATVFWQLFQLYAVIYFYVYGIFYALIVGFAHAVDYYQLYRERERAAARLEAQLAQSQLQVLRMQLQPHFLFNALNTITALVHKDVRLAERMIARLGELLRATLDQPARQETTLRQELAFLTPYLEIERARIGPRLTVTTAIDDDILDAKLPYLLLQPLVENSMRHGLAPRPGPGRLDIRARRDGDRLVLTVADDGLGLPDGGPREGIGLSNTRGRLQGLYGQNQSLTLRAGLSGQGLSVTAILPFRTDAGPVGVGIAGRIATETAVPVA